MGDALCSTVVLQMLIEHLLTSDSYRQDFTMSQLASTKRNSYIGTVAQTPSSSSRRPESCTQITLHTDQVASRCAIFYGLGGPCLLLFFSLSLFVFVFFFATERARSPLLNSNNRNSRPCASFSLQYFPSSSGSLHTFSRRCL